MFHETKEARRLSVPSLLLSLAWWTEGWGTPGKKPTKLSAVVFSPLTLSLSAAAASKKNANKLLPFTDGTRNFSPACSLSLSFFRRLRHTSRSSLRYMKKWKRSAVVMCCTRNNKNTSLIITLRLYISPCVCHYVCIYMIVCCAFLSFCLRLSHVFALSLSLPLILELLFSHFNSFAVSLFLLLIISRSYFLFTSSYSHSLSLYSM